MHLKPVSFTDSQIEMQFLQDYDVKSKVLTAANLDSSLHQVTVQLTLYIKYTCVSLLCFLKTCSYNKLFISSGLPKVIIHRLEEKFVIWSIEGIFEVSQSNTICRYV